MQVSAWLYLFQQSMLTFCLLLTLHRAAHLPRPSSTRLCAASLAMGVGTLLTVMQDVRWRGACPALLTLLIPLAVWPKLPRGFRIRLTLVFAALSLLLTGWMRMLAGLGFPPQLVFPLGCALALLLPALPVQNTAACTGVRITLGHRSITLTALVDSGNLLRDRASGLPVIVVDRNAARPLFPSVPTTTALPDMRAMPVRTVTGTALMTVFRPDTLMLELEGRWHTTQAMIGLAPEAHAGMEALIPAVLLTKLNPLMDDKEDLPCP